RFLRSYAEEERNNKIKECQNIKQVHGNEIVLIKKDVFKSELVKKNISQDRLKAADGIITDFVDLPILIRTADCVPVFLFDEKFKVVGLVHAGWRSTHLGIVKKAVVLTCDEYSSEPDNIRIVFGPAIRSCCYEVGLEFKERFDNSVFERDGRYWFDLVKENIHQLEGLFPQGKNLFDCGICTCCDERYFSYRREGALAGRNLSIMMIKGE
ncbi:MAG: polyphenol oxidase family protein, partial [Candidatus Omnitrophica bacterium]|nr:polyphenol oxidase family protein [Candidatus Omnitrophota bacterium]